MSKRKKKKKKQHSLVDYQSVNVTKSWNQRPQEGHHQDQSSLCCWRQEKEEEKKGILCHLHIQSLETGSSGHWCFQQGHVNHEQLRQRHFQKN